MEMYRQALEIQPIFDKVIAYSQQFDPDCFDTDEIFDKWMLNKLKLFEAFGEKLIYEYPEEVEFHLDEDSKNTRLRSFIHYIFDKDFQELGTFLDTNFKQFYKNQLEDDYQTNDGKIITKGTKLIKSFKYFIDDKKTLEMLQNKASMMLQEDKVSGKLCISIHPLDYLSLSENTYNWRSCHALDGCFRAGNLSYMIDNCTIVCYLKSKEDCKLPHFPEDVLWNNKKWRVLLYLSDDWRMIFASRQYPFNTSQGLEKIRELFLNNIKNSQVEFSTWDGTERCVWVDWSNYNISSMPIGDKNTNFQHYLDDRYYLVGDQLMPLNELMQNKGSTHYNDVQKSPYYAKPYYTMLAKKAYGHSEQTRYYLRTDENKTVFTVGDTFSCLHCHSNNVERCRDTFMCDDCELEYGHSNNSTFTTCAVCGTRLYVNNAFEEDDNENVHYCEDCWNDMIVHCAFCDKEIRRGDAAYDCWNDRYYCVDCEQGDDSNS